MFMFMILWINFKENVFYYKNSLSEYTEGH